MRASKLLWTIGVLICSPGCSSQPTKAGPEAVVTAPREAQGKAREPAAPRGRTYSFSPSDSSVNFVAAKVTRSHQGFFGGFKGTIDLVDSQPELSSVQIEIDMKSIQTDEARLTTHLKSPDLLDVEKYPRATFHSTSIGKAPAGGRSHLVTGDFELHGVRKSIQFPVDIRINEGGVDADGDFSFKRQDFGITYPGMPDDLIKDDVSIKLKVRAKPDAV